MKRPFSTSRSSVDPKEVKKFEFLAQKWWDEEGEYSALHSMNDIRVPFIRYGFEDRFLNNTYYFYIRSVREKQLQALKLHIAATKAPMCLPLIHPFCSRDTLLNMSSNYHLGSPLSGVKILDIGCGGGLLSEVRNGVLWFLSLKSIQCLSCSIITLPSF